SREDSDTRGNGAPERASAAPRWLRKVLPVLAVLTVAIALMYPAALLFGRTVARRHMDNLSNWLRTNVTALPLAVLPGGAAEGAAAGARLSFGGRTQRDLVDDLATPSITEPAAVLVFGGQPLDVAFAMVDGDVVLTDAIDMPLVVTD